jgi:hypothetical protein
MKLPGWPVRRRDRGWDDDAGDPAVRAMSGLAEGPLSPDADALARMKSAAMAAFREANAASAADAASLAPSARVVSTEVRRSAPRRFRLAAAGLAVALLTVSGAGFAAAESGPGQPFYRTRLAVESLFLPPAGSDARLDADLDRAQARLDEALAAASQDDWNAEADAMSAYVDVVASISVPGDAAAVERLRLRLDQQLLDLQKMRGAQGGAGQEVGKAIDSVDSVLRRAGGSPSPGPMGSPGGGQANPTPEPSSGGQGGQGGQDGQSGGGGQGTAPSSSGGPMGSTGPMGSGQGGAPSPGQGGGPGQGDAGGMGQGGPGGSGT